MPPPPERVSDYLRKRFSRISRVYFSDPSENRIEYARLGCPIVYSGKKALKL